MLIRITWGSSEKPRLHLSQIKSESFRPKWSSFNKYLSLVINGEALRCLRSAPGYKTSDNRDSANLELGRFIVFTLWGDGAFFIEYDCRDPLKSIRDMWGPRPSVSVRFQLFLFAKLFPKARSEVGPWGTSPGTDWGRNRLSLGSSNPVSTRSNWRDSAEALKSGQSGPRTGDTGAVGSPLLVCPQWWLEPLTRALYSQALKHLQAPFASPWWAIVRTFWETQSYNEENWATLRGAGKLNYKKEKAWIVFAVLLCYSKILQITKILGFNCCCRTDTFSCSSHRSLASRRVSGNKMCIIPFPGAEQTSDQNIYVLRWISNKSGLQTMAQNFRFLERCLIFSRIIFRFPEGPTCRALGESYRLVPRLKGTAWKHDLWQPFPHVISGSSGQCFLGQVFVCWEHTSHFPCG